MNSVEIENHDFLTDNRRDVHNFAYVSHRLHFTALRDMMKDLLLLRL
jgi:hypothetical protein